MNTETSESAATLGIAKGPAPKPVKKPAPVSAELQPGEMPVQEPNAISSDDPRRPGFVRQPFGAVSLKLSAPKRKGYHRHWFNDVLDRLQEAKAAGYTHVCKENTAIPMSRVVGAAKGGGPLTAYLMECPEEWFRQDYAAQQAVVDEIDAAIRGGTVATKEGDERYVPPRGIAVTEETRRIAAPDDEEE